MSQTDRLSRPKKRAWVASTLVVCAVFLATTIVGDDAWFPAAPFRMFSTAVNPDGNVEMYRVEGVDENGRRMLMSQQKTGVRWADVMGQTDEMAKDPSQVERIAHAYERRNPDHPKIVAVEVIFAIWHLENGSLSGECDDEVMASWYADDTEKPEPSDGSLSNQSCSRGDNFR